MTSKLSEAALNDAVIKELISGRQLLDSLDKYRDVPASKIAKDYRKLGVRRTQKFRHVLEVPQFDYLAIAQKYGTECWDDKEFIKDAQKLEPGWASNKL